MTEENRFIAPSYRMAISLTGYVNITVMPEHESPSPLSNEAIFSAPNLLPEAPSHEQIAEALQATEAPATLLKTTNNIVDNIDNPYSKTLALIAIGDLEGAIATSQQIDDEDAWHDTQQMIAAAQAQAGNIDAAKRTAANLSDGQDFAYARIAAVQAQNGDFAGAKNTASDIYDDHWLKEANEAINEATAKQALAQVESGNFDLATATAATVEDEFYRSELQQDIITAQARHGDIAGAKAALSKLENNIYNYEILTDIAEIQIETGDLLGAKATIAELQDDEFEVDQQQVFDDLAKEVSLSQARKIPTDAPSSNWQLIRLAQTQLQQEDIPGAINTMSELDDEDLEHQLRLDIIRAQAKLGDIEGANATAAALNEYGQTQAKKEIAMAQAQRGAVAEVQQTSANLSPEFKAQVYSQTAKTLEQSAPTPEQANLSSSLHGADRSLNVGAFWPEIATNRADSLVMASKLTSARQALGMLSHVELNTKNLDHARRADVVSNFLQDINLTHEADDEIFEGMAGHRLKRLTNLDTDSSQLQTAFEVGFPMAAIARHPWLLDPDLTNPDDPYPLHSGIAEQQRYLTDHSFTDLAGFNRSTMGKFLAIRLDHGNEPTLHDASQWLSTFALGEERLKKGAYDIKRLKEIGGAGADLNLDLFREPLWDEEAATNLLAGLVNLSDEQRFRLPGHANPSDMGRYEDMLLQPAHTLVYRALLEHGANQPTPEQLKAAVDDLIEEYWETQPEIMVTRKEQPVRPASREALSREAHTLIARSFVRSAQGDLEPPSKYIGELRSIAKNRKAYLDDATTWLQRHSTTPHELLSKAWEDRPLALAEGCADNATTIAAWATANAVRTEARHRADEEGIIHHPKGDFDTKRLTGDLQPLTAELARCYGAESTLKAVMKLDRQPAPEADLPATKLELEGGYRFEVLEKRDPRGFTIGYDTGCCMTLGGESESCIWAGYRDSRYAFVALYGPDGRLLAQSLAYHNPDESSDTLVLDNIEANAGRNLRKIRDLYLKAFSAYLGPDGAAAEKWTKVQVGEGYSDVALSDLPEAEPIATPKKGTYSDSHNQRLLLDLNNHAQQAKDPVV